MEFKQPKPSPRLVRQLAKSLRGSVREVVTCGHHRSTQASLTELAIEVGGFKQILAEPARLKAALAQARDQAARPVVMPAAAKVTGPVTQFRLAGHQAFVLNAQPSAQAVIIYLAGGAYFQAPLKLHWEFCDRLARATGARVLLAVYPLAPTQTYHAAYAFLDQLYRHVYAQTPVSQITLMGDSAGAGLAAGFCEHLGQSQGPQPGHLVLISPWLDLDLTNAQIPALAQYDVTLAPAGLRQIGQLWAGTTDHRDYHLSPLLGPVANLRQVMIYVGTDELMCPDALAYTERLRAAGVAVTCHLGRQLFHSYPLYPIPEGEQVMQALQQLINPAGVRKDD